MGLGGWEGGVGGVGREGVYVPSSEGPEIEKCFIILWWWCGGGERGEGGGERERGGAKKSSLCNFSKILNCRWLGRINGS